MRSHGSELQMPWQGEGHHSGRPLRCSGPPADTSRSRVAADHSTFAGSRVAYANRQTTRAANHTKPAAWIRKKAKRTDTTAFV
jgi:hypothetical protein